MYDRSGGGTRFRTNVSVNPGWWHTYKHAAMKIWERFAPTLIAPLWHHLYPNSQFHIKPSSFPSVQYHFLALHLAYPRIRDKLMAQLENGKHGHRRHLNGIKDMIFFFEFALPTVPLFCFTTVAFELTCSVLVVGLWRHDETFVWQLRSENVVPHVAPADGPHARKEPHVHPQHHVQLLVLLHQRANKTCACQMLEGSLSTFNEEGGEMTFGLVARCILGDTHARRFAHLNTIYNLIHFWENSRNSLGTLNLGSTKTRTGVRRVTQQMKSLTMSFTS